MDETMKNAVLTALHERRSIRKFTAAPVSREDVHTILDAGRWAPSGKNNQPCRFLVLRSGDERQGSLSDCTKYPQLINGAAILICIYLDKEACYDERKDHQSAGACIENMLLAIHALGLGAVWVGEIINQAADVNAVLGVDGERYELQAVLAVGHPDQPGKAVRNELSEYMLEAF
ncbi:nitroreductase family protein [Oceanidesulfovibrio marinus]|uniref:Nitroreductase family protein n=1 Tax=Oceanidesulfovibrio marinus TaxID=370038 RepID=A0ABX6NIN8_9BACT|nr:nitroreductase family protein [Oceanidesulfovibrio marinus]QJT10438.1 nitroreductase family protein [Oceanidesulfovibrio marinus]